MKLSGNVEFPWAPGIRAWPLQFQSQKGMVFPVFHVFRMLFQYPAYRVLKIKSSHPLLVNGFALAGNEKE
jgi:hypothetical protein